MPQFGDEVRGRTFKRGGIVFMVMEVEAYPRDRVTPQFREVLNAPPGTLVAIPYRGTLIPNISVRGGVVRLTKIAVLGSVCKTPKTISESLGVIQPYRLYTLHRIE